MKIFMDLATVQSASDSLIQSSIELLQEAQKIVAAARKAESAPVKDDLDGSARALLRVSDELAAQAKRLSMNIVRLNSNAA